MNQLQGFIFSKPLIGKVNYLFHKIGKQEIQQGTISFSKLLSKSNISDQEAYILNGSGFTLCLTNQATEKQLKTLSIIANCLAFDMNFATKTAALSIYGQGELKGKRTCPIETIQKSSGLFGLFGKSDSLEATFLNQFDQFSKHIRLQTSIPNLLKKQVLSVFKIGPIPVKYHDTNTFSTNATPFYPVHSKIMELMPSPNGYELFFKTDHDGSPMTEEKYAVRVKEAIALGVVSPAILLQHSPFVVAVYSSDIDGVVILNFNEQPTLKERFKNCPRGYKMLSVNTYLYQSSSGLTDGVEVDLIEGPNSSKMWKSVQPHILDFIIDDLDQPLLNYWKQKYTVKDWQKLVRLKTEYFQRYPGQFRIGFFMYNTAPTLKFVKAHCPHLLDNDDIKPIGKI